MPTIGSPRVGPLAVRSRAYDLVVNGREIGSGSIRITDPAIQQRVLAALGIDAEEAQRKFGFCSRPSNTVSRRTAGGRRHRSHVMEGLGTDNIRDVIAYPKNQQAQEPMTDAACGRPRSASRPRHRDPSTTRTP